MKKKNFFFLIKKMENYNSVKKNRSAFWFFSKSYKPDEDFRGNRRNLIKAKKEAFDNLSKKGKKEFLDYEEEDLIRYEEELEEAYNKLSKKEKKIVDLEREIEDAEIHLDILRSELSTLVD